MFGIGEEKKGYRPITEKGIRNALRNVDKVAKKFAEIDEECDKYLRGPSMEDLLKVMHGYYS